MTHLVKVVVYITDVRHREAAIEPWVRPPGFDVQASLTGLSKLMPPR